MNFPVIKKYISPFTSPKTKMVVLISFLEILLLRIKKKTEINPSINPSNSNTNTKIVIKF